MFAWRKRWLTQAQIAMLFETTPQNITMHLNNVFDEGELDENSTDFLQVREEKEKETMETLILTLITDYQE